MKFSDKIIKEAMSVGANGFSFDSSDFDMTPMSEELRMGFLEHGDLLGLKGQWANYYEQTVMEASTTEDIRDFLVTDLEMDVKEADEMIKSVIDYFGAPGDGLF